jgi:ribonuclease P/MRP protein subunit POP5
MRKAEEEAIRRARRDIVRMRKGEEDSVLGVGLGVVEGKKYGISAEGPMGSEEEFEDLDMEDEESDDE